MAKLRPTLEKCFPSTCSSRQGVRISFKWGLAYIHNNPTQWDINFKHVAYVERALWRGCLGRQIAFTIEGTPSTSRIHIKKYKF